MLKKNNCNVKFTKNWCNLIEDQKYIGSPITKQEQLQYKFILCIDGNGRPGNLEWVFLQVAVPVIICEWYVWFYKFLIPGFHYVKINPDLSDLLPIVNDLIQNPEKYKKNAENAKQFALDYLKSKAIKNIFLKM